MYCDSLRSIEDPDDGIAGDPAETDIVEVDQEVTNRADSNWKFYLK